MDHYATMYRSSALYTIKKRVCFSEFLEKRSHFSHLNPQLRKDEVLKADGLFAFMVRLLGQQKPRSSAIDACY